MIWFLQKLAQTLVNILAPEERRLDKLLSLEPATLSRLLPRSSIYGQDVTILFDYQNKMVRALVKAMKFKNNLNVRQLLSEMLYEEFVNLASDTALFEGSYPILLPMPMSKDEKKGRGWNQCEELAREIQKMAGNQIKTHFNILQKIRNTERQVKLSRTERLKNLKNCMQVFDPQNILKNKVIVVLDDIHTTGSTFAEARRALLASGAKRILGLFLAH